MSQGLSNTKFSNAFKQIFKLLFYSLIVAMMLLIIAIRWLDIALNSANTSTHFFDTIIQAEQWQYQRQKNRVIIRAKHINSTLLNHDIKIEQLELSTYLFTPLFKKINALKYLATAPSQLTIQSASVISKESNQHNPYLNPVETIVQLVVNSKQQALSSKWATLFNLEHIQLDINDLNIQLASFRAEIDTLDFNMGNSTNRLVANGQFQIAKKDLVFKVTAEQLANDSQWQLNSVIKHALTNEQNQLITTRLDFTGKTNMTSWDTDGRMQFKLIQDKKTKLLLQSLTTIHPAQHDKRTLDITLSAVNLNQKPLNELHFNWNPSNTRIKLLAPTTINLTTLQETLAHLLHPSISRLKSAGKVLLSQLDWQLKSPYPTKIHAEVKDAYLASVQHNFRVKHLNLLLKKSPKPQEFTWQILTDKLEVDLTELYNQPIILNTQLTGKITRNKLGQWELRNNSQQQLIKNVFAQFKIKFDPTNQANNSYQLQIKTQRLPFNSYKQLIPNKLSIPLLDWLKTNFLQSEIEDFTLNYQPQHPNPDEQLKVEFISAPGQFRLMPHWPAMLRNKAKVTFNPFTQPVLTIRIDRVTFVNTQYSIPHINFQFTQSDTSGTLLYIKTHIPLKNHGEKVLASFRLTPIPELIKLKPFFDTLDYQGKLSMALDLRLPLDDIAEERHPLDLKLDLELRDGLVSYKKVLLKNFSAKFKIDENDIQSHYIKTRLKHNYGIFNWVNAKLLPQNAQGQKKITLSTVINSAKISPFLRGYSTLTSIISFSRQSFNTENQPAADPIIIQSHTSLLGVDSYLPNQFSKSATTTIPLDINVSILNTSRQLKLNWGEKLVSMNLAWKANQLQYAHIGIASSTQSFTKDGIYIVGNIPVIKPIQWQPIFTKGLLSSSAKHFLNDYLEASQDDRNARSKFFEWLANSRFKLLKVNINTLNSDIFTDNNIEMVMRPLVTPHASPQTDIVHPTNTAKTYYVIFNGNNNQGTLSFNEYQLSINFNKLHIKAHPTDTASCSPIKNPVFQQLDVNVTKLMLGQELLGSTYFIARNTKDKLKIPNLHIVNKDNKIFITDLVYHYPKLTLSNTNVPPFLRRGSKNLPLSLYSYGKTEANIQIQSNNFEALQKQFGFYLTGYRANFVEIQGNVKFYGGLIGCLKPENIEGDFEISAKEGAAQGVNIGLGQILAVINARTIFDRLISSAQEAFNRRKLEQFGSYFKQLKSKLTVHHNRINIQSLSLDSSVAHIRMEGNIHTKQKTYDLKATIKPKIADGFITAATLFNGVVIGFLTYVTVSILELLGLDNLLSYQLDIKGSYHNPTLKTIADE